MRVQRRSPLFLFGIWFLWSMKRDFYPDNSHIWFYYMCFLGIEEWISNRIEDVLFIYSFNVYISFLQNKLCNCKHSKGSHFSRKSLAVIVEAQMGSESCRKYFMKILSYYIPFIIAHSVPIHFALHFVYSGYAKFILL